MKSCPQITTFHLKMKTFEDACNSGDSVSLTLIGYCKFHPDRAIKLVGSVFNANIPHNRKLEIINYSNGHETSLHAAIDGGSRSLIRLLLEKGSNPNVRIHDTPILRACCYRNKNDVTKLLLK